MDIVPKLLSLDDHAERDEAASPWLSDLAAGAFSEGARASEGPFVRK
jgi:hypothetical protein